MGHSHASRIGAGRRVKATELPRGLGEQLAAQERGDWGRQPLGTEPGGGLSLLLAPPHSSLHSFLFSSLPLIPTLIGEQAGIQLGEVCV